MKSVAILGCGPTGLLCAWAVEQAGHLPLIFSKRFKSEIPGSQHLHGPVPNLTSQYPEGVIQFVRMGTPEEYAKKVYGDATRTVGWGNYLQQYPSWNVLKAYDRLWDHFYHDIADQEITQEFLHNIVRACDVVISTVPGKVLCYRPGDHHFNGVDYYIKKLPTPPLDADHELVVYNGLPGDPWYRWSILGGLCSIESTQDIWPTDESVIEGIKATDNNCDCWPTISRCGRWAEWTHGVTMFKAYQKARQIAAEL